MLYNDKYHWLLIEDYALHESVGIAVAAQRAQQQQQQSELHLTDADEQEQPIERLMETLNFYMNTEVTLAKRSTGAAEGRYTLYDVWYVQGAGREVGE